jgi:hypothetical protein
MNNNDDKENGGMKKIYEDLKLHYKGFFDYFFLIVTFTILVTVTFVICGSIVCVGYKIIKYIFT